MPSGYRRRGKTATGRVMPFSSWPGQSLVPSLLSPGFAEAGRHSNPEEQMRGRFLTVGLALGLSGCFTPEKTTVIQPGLTGPPAATQVTQIPQAPATQEVALRVATLGRKIVAD